MGADLVEAQVDPVLELVWNLIRAYHLNHAAVGITTGSLDSSTPVFWHVMSFARSTLTTSTLTHRNRGLQGKDAPMGQ
jgi:hypothetical protein